MIKVRAHTCYLGNTGYASHSRNFFRSLSKYVDLRVRNYTWDPDPSYLNEVDYNIIDTITLRGIDGKDSDYAISHSFPKRPWTNSESHSFIPDVDIVLMDMNHYYFYDNYSSDVKIAYTVWESTRLPEDFFNQLLKFDYLWVVSEWHKKVAISQGYPAFRIFVVPEGVEGSLYFKEPSKKERGSFEFMFFGRWDYRKAVPEIIESFIKAFPEEKEVSLILSADNPYSIDGFNSTEERISHYGFNDDRIKVKHFLKREEYEDYLKNGHVLITCARSEGWNIPLIEAMAAGTPSIYSEWGAQLEFAKGKGNPVKIKEEKLASIGSDLGFSGDTPGFYSEPDFENLVEVLRDCYKNWEDKKQRAIKEAQEIYESFNWENIGKIGFEVLKSCSGKKRDFQKEELSVVLSHADTEEKINLLSNCLKRLRRQGYFTVVSTHIPVPRNIFDLCDGVIYDSDNPVVYPEEYEEFSNTVPVHYLNYPLFEVSYSFDFNHGYAAMKLIKNGISFAESNGYDLIHFVNYDYIINDPKVLTSHEDSLYSGSADLVSYIWNGEDSINSAFFSAKTEKIKNALWGFNSKKDYFKYPGKVILEDVLFEASRESGMSIESRDIEFIKDKNEINSYILSTYPQVINSLGEKSHIYLCEENGNFYLGIMGFPSEPIYVMVKFKGEESLHSAERYGMDFIRIPYEILSEGFDIEVIGLDYQKNYDLKTKRASCRIKSPELIKELNFNVEPMEEKEEVIFGFVDGPKIEILGNGNSKYRVEFIDLDNNETVYSDVIGINCWSKPSRKYFTNWFLRATNLNTGKAYEHQFDLEGKNVLAYIDSSALGDNISWFPHIEEFRKKHKCNVFVSTFKNFLFEKNYPDLNFILPGSSVDNLYASYPIGWFYTEENEPNYNRHPRDFRKQPMQATTTDILGLEYTSLRPKLYIPDLPRPMEEKYVCLAMHSTAQSKYWNNPTGWQEVTDHFLEKGWKIIMLSLEHNGYMGNYYPEGVISPEGERTLENAMNYLRHSEMFIGISSGLSWLSWAVGTPTVLISGWSWPCTEVLGDDVIRIFKGGSCNGCFNRKRLDAGDWNFCPDQKGTARQFECSRIITGKYVISQIEEYLEKGKSYPSVEQIIQESYELGMVQNHKEILKASEFFKSLDVENFMEIGTDQGGTFAIWSKLSKDGKRVSVDLPHGEFGRMDYNLQKRDEYLKSLGSNVQMYHGSSHEEEMKNRVKKQLGKTLLDFLFIDGDHTYEGVKKDFEMYKEFVKPGGWIGFHDIKDTEFHRNANCRVDILWNELEGEKIEFLDNSSSYGGIGFIRV